MDSGDYEEELGREGARGGGGGREQEEEEGQQYEVEKGMSRGSLG